MHLKIIKMKNLTNNGYRIEIKGWVGNFGNHMLQLSGALKVAIETESVLTYPQNKIIPNQIFDFRSAKNSQCNLKVTSLFFYHDECFQYPLIYDQERREIAIKYILPLLKKKYNRITNDNQNWDIENTLVINIRSGDIFRDDYNSEDAIKSGIKNYVQPPLAFYKKIIGQFFYKNIIIVTQPDKRNPVIQELLKQYDKIIIKEHISPLDDFMMLLDAKHLVTCHSSFSWFAALISENLLVLHQPQSFSVKGINDYDVYTYNVENYIPYGSWKATKENLKKMINLQEKNIHVFYKKAHSYTAKDSLPLSTFAVHRGWVPDNNVEVYVQTKWNYLTLQFKKIVRPRTRIKLIVNKLKKDVK
jgi:hypothetical protein